METSQITDWRWNCDLATAQQLADERNGMLGLAPQDVDTIIASTLHRVKETT